MSSHAGSQFFFKKGLYMHTQLKSSNCVSSEVSDSLGNLQYELNSFVHIFMANLYIKFGNEGEEKPKLIFIYFRWWEKSI